MEETKKNRANLPFKKMMKQKGLVIFDHPDIKDTKVVDIVDDVENFVVPTTLKRKKKI